MNRVIPGQMQLFCSACLACLWAVSLVGNSAGQSPVIHRFSGTDDTPGTVAFHSLIANPQWVGKTQPVKFLLPENTDVFVWSGTWQQANYANPTVATMIGPVYTVKIAGQFRTTTFELFPSIELVSCLNPPADLQIRFPVLIAISEADIEQVRGGRLVTKVIYLESPDTALPYRQVANDQSYFDVTSTEDPLHVAERFGRPVAIVRMGTRQPMAEDLNLMNAAPVPMTIFPAQAARDLDRRMVQVGYSEQLKGAALEQSRTTAKPAAFRLSPTGIDNPNASTASENDFLPRQLPGTAPQIETTPAVQMSNPCDLCPNPENQFAEPFHRDEFLLDGGDREQKVIVDHDWTLRGLDTEDTIGHFDTLEGRRIAVPTNRVAIYAPRFAAVRKISDLMSESRPTRVSKMDDSIELKTTQGKDITSTTLQQLQPKSHASNLRARGFIDQTRGVPAEGIVHLRGANDAQKVKAQHRTQRFGGFSNSESARQELAAVAARSWEDDLGLQVTIQKAQAVIVRDAAKAHQLITVKTDEGDSQLKIIKSASAIAAKPGDEIDFTIEFQNVGARRIGNVTIVDNLTTRLEFVPDSATCSVKANFTHEQNQAGSLVLRWEIQDPLDVNQSGTIRFKCRVR